MMEVGILRKGIKRDLLILLGCLIDELNAWSFHNQMRRWMFDGWYKKSSVGPALSRLLSVGDIERIEKQGQVFYRLTSRGSERLKQSLPLVKLAQKPWDRKWRMVIFDIKEEKRVLREALRRKLLSLGFGKWQRSVYITPHAIQQELNQYLKSKRLFPACVCLLAQRSELGDDRALANKVWRLDELNEEYDDFIWDCQQLARRAEATGVKTPEIRQLWIRFKELLLSDPHLPKVLLPNNWLAEKARLEMARACSNMLRSPHVRTRGEDDHG